LTLPLEEARRNDEIISIADSQMLRWIDELNGVTDADERAKEVRTRIRNLRRQPNSAQNKRELRKLYAELDQ
jgi:plasmid stabilization system protein ParE